MHWVAYGLHERIARKITVCGHEQVMLGVYQTLTLLNFAGPAVIAIVLFMVNHKKWDIHQRLRNKKAAGPVCSRHENRSEGLASEGKPG